MLDAKPRWQRTASNLGIEWIDAAVTDWIGKVRDWLGDAAAGESGAA